VYTLTEIGALRSNRRIIVVTVLTRKSSLDFAFDSRYCRFRGKITPSIAVSRADDGAQLTRRNCIHTRLGQSWAISLFGKIE
jgi:hypothetical protein